MFAAASTGYSNGDTKVIIHRPSLRTLVGKRNIVGAEIGVGEGKNSLNILENLDIQTLYLIDPYEEFGKGNPKFDRKAWNPKAQAMIGLKRVSQNLSSFEDKTIQLLMTSFDAAREIEDGELDFVYIDGSHRYSEVKEDIAMYQKKVKIGGLIAGHDYNRNGKKKSVRAAVDEFFGEGTVQSGVVMDTPQRTEDWWIIRQE